MINRFKLIFNILVLSILLNSCSDSGTEPEENIVLPADSLNYNDHIYPLFSSKCSSRNGCHTFDNPAANLPLTDYTKLISHTMNETPGRLLIQIGDGENSPLYQVLIQDGFLGVPQMPYNGPYLNSNQYEGVFYWIEEGANP